MIRQSVDYLNGLITALNIYSEVNCLCEKIKKGAQVYPALYASGQYKMLEFDKRDGLAYWRKTGEVSFDTVENITTGVGIKYQIRTPLRFVGFVKKSKLANNDQYTNDELALAIIKAITTTNPGLAASISAESVKFAAKSYNTDSEDILQDEYDKVDFKPRYEYSYLRIDGDLLVTTKNNCLPAYC